VYYKTGRYVVKQYEQETNFEAYLLLDISESMAFEYEHGSRLDYAAFMATTLAHVIINQSDSVGAYLFADRLQAPVRVGGSEEVPARIAQALEQARPGRATDFGRVLSQAAEDIGRRRVVFILSDFFGDLESIVGGLRRLLDDKHEIVLLQILDPIELEFSLPGRMRLLQLEGTGRRDVLGSGVRDTYQRLFRQFLRELEQAARGLGIDYLRCNMAQPFGHHLAEYFSGRAAKAR
jgi:uncharacterized protein (DUF58 family)